MDFIPGIRSATFAGAVPRWLSGVRQHIAALQVHVSKASLLGYLLYSLFAMSRRLFSTSGRRLVQSRHPHRQPRVQSLRSKTIGKCIVKPTQLYARKLTKKSPAPGLNAGLDTNSLSAGLALIATWLTEPWGMPWSVRMLQHIVHI